jgi:hypothetical protein
MNNMLLIQPFENFTVTEALKFEELFSIMFQASWFGRDGFYKYMDVYMD